MRKGVELIATDDSGFVLDVVRICKGYFHLEAGRWTLKMFNCRYITVGHPSSC